jgi:hypothetical protein
MNMKANEVSSLAMNRSEKHVYLEMEVTFELLWGTNESFP